MLFRRELAFLCVLTLSSLAPPLLAQDLGYERDAFRQLDELLPTPTATRLASGAPGPEYWQQQADYEIEVKLDDQRQRIEGSEQITYHNNSPHALSYLWLQLDQNRFRQGSEDQMTQLAPPLKRLSFESLQDVLETESFEGGFQITRVTDGEQQELPHTIVGTMMRVDLPNPLAPGERTQLGIAWEHNVVNAKVQRARGGYEYFEKDQNYIYEIAQWYPRMAAYTDYAGWQHKPFLGSGEFTLEFGNYRVAITVPADHIVGATGTLQNGDEVLSAEQRSRLDAAKSSERVEFIVTPAEAKSTEAAEVKPSGTKTWLFAADNVRDFAWASSRKFIWDAKYHPNGNGRVWAMSYYPNEAEPLWSKYSTQAVAHTLDVYSKFTFDYPYPVAISVNGPVFGMEYPMICFNGPRPEEDGTYSERTKLALISVVIHEVGHNYFPMIVNSDERQWTWMDEGINSFLQFLAEREWQQVYRTRRGKPRQIVSYMVSNNQMPIMTNSESIHQFGDNAYSKPTAALNVLRETVMGRELFDFAFREYSRRWMYKRPEPADFFRTMEDASGMDLDWFWRGWFYTTHHVDVGIVGLRLHNIDTRNPDIEKPLKRAERNEVDAKDLIDERNRPLPKRVDKYPELKDFYNSFDELDVTQQDRRSFTESIEKLDEHERQLLSLQKNFYVVELQNLGGLVSPVILQVFYADGTNETLRLPAEIWRQDREHVNRLILTGNTIDRLELDPRLETADSDRDNNYWPPRPAKSRFQLFKDKKEKNPMQQAREEEQNAAGKGSNDRTEGNKSDNADELEDDSEPKDD